MAPDLDLLPGLLQGKPILYHGGISHSLTMGLCVSLLVALFSRWRGFSFRTTFVFGFSAYASHLLLDMLGPDGREPYGIPLFWPLVDATYLFPRPLLLGVHHASSASAGLAEFLRGVFSLHNVAALLIETLLILTIWMSFLLIKRRDSICPRLFPKQIRPNSHNRHRKKSYISEKRTT